MSERPNMFFHIWYEARVDIMICYEILSICDIVCYVQISYMLYETGVMDLGYW